MCVVLPTTSEESGKGLKMESELQNYLASKTSFSAVPIKLGVLGQMYVQLSLKRSIETMESWLRFLFFAVLVSSTTG